MKSKTKNSPDLHEVITSYLKSYAYLPEMKEDGSVFEKRKIKNAVFSADKTQLILSGGATDNVPYCIVLKSLRKVYSRIDREFDKIIISGFISIGEDFTLSERTKLTIYLKGYPKNLHVGVKIKNALLDFAKKLNA